MFNSTLHKKDKITLIYRNRADEVTFFSKEGDYETLSSLLEFFEYAIKGMGFYLENDEHLDFYSQEQKDEV